MKQATLSFGKRPREEDDPHDAPTKKRKPASDPLAVAELPPDLSIPALLSNQPPRAVRKVDLDLLVANGFISSRASQKFFQYLRRELPWYRVCYTKGGSTARLRAG
jgi:hypothetical protein